MLSLGKSSQDEILSRWAIRSNFSDQAGPLIHVLPSNSQKEFTTFNLGSRSIIFGKDTKWNRQKIMNIDTKLGDSISSCNFDIWESRKGHELTVPLCLYSPSLHTFCFTTQSSDFRV